MDHTDPDDLARRQKEADRLFTLADKIEGRIPQYEAANPALAAEAKATAKLYRNKAKELLRRGA